MEKNIKKLEEIISNYTDVMDDVIFNNAGGTLQSIGDTVEDRMIIHEAYLSALLNEMKGL